MIVTPISEAGKFVEKHQIGYQFNPFQVDEIYSEIVDLKKNVASIKGPLSDKITEFLFNDCYYINGGAVKEFENNFAKYIETEHCLGLNSGTDALKLSAKMLGLKPGDEVLVQGNTFIGSVSGIAELGCKLKMLDIDPDTFMVDISKIERECG